MNGYDDVRMAPDVEPGVQPATDCTYIAGPMTGYPEWNEPAFRAMAKRLRALGIPVISPNELHAPDPEKSREWYLRRDLEVVVAKCNRVVFLPGWERSWGATLEHHVAKELAMELVYPHEFNAWVKRFIKDQTNYTSEAAAASRHADEVMATQMQKKLERC